jgi:nucleoside-diphosphate-sugar epimerase
MAAAGVKVFMTGGTGLVGRHVLAALVERGDEVTALARSDEAAAALTRAGARPLLGHLGDRKALEAGTGRAEVVIHAAAAILDRRPWDHYRATNVVATETVARMAAASGCRMIHLSSVAVYGRRTVYDGGGESVTEEFGLDRPMFPGDHYARSKREAEQALWRVAGETGLRALAFRPCVLYGEGDRTFSNRVARALARGWAPLVGDGRNPMSVVYAGNVAAAIAAALDRPEATGPFNVANDGRLTQREFVEAFARGLGVRLRLLRVPRPLAWNGARLLDALVRAARPGARMSTLKTAVQFLAGSNPYDSTRAARELGWIPPVEPREAVERTGRWFRDPRSR